MAEERDWSPEDEIDPAKFQKEYLEIAKDLVAEMKAKKAAATKDTEEAKKMMAGLGSAISPFARAFKPPTFSETSAKLKKCWEEVKKIAPDAPEFVQAEIIRALMHTPDVDEAAQLGM